MASPPRVFIVAISGSTCSGKTTLAKHLHRILPGALLLHQDDFAPPESLIPIHPVYGVQDWDDAPGAIDWPLQRTALAYLREHGTFPPGHKSHDEFNVLSPVPVPEELVEHWKVVFRDLVAPKPANGTKGEPETVFVLADGFLMLYDQPSAAQFDIKLFVREPYEVLKQRREERSGYHTAEGTMWRDPPSYWQNIVWPSYLAAHRPLFVDGNVEAGVFDESKIAGVEILEGAMGMEKMVVRACQSIETLVRSSKAS